MTLPAFWGHLPYVPLAFFAGPDYIRDGLWGHFWWNFEPTKEEGPRLIAYPLQTPFTSEYHPLRLVSAKRHLNFTNPVLYATPAVYPYYILHQTVIVASGYYKFNGYAHSPKTSGPYCDSF